MWDEDETPLPPALERFNKGHRGEYLYGDFKICPLERGSPGVSRHIRIRSARNLIFDGKRFR